MLEPNQRYCPKCNCTITHKTQSDAQRRHKEKRLCRSCGVKRGLAKRYADPEFRKKCSAIHKQRWYNTSESDRSKHAKNVSKGKKESWDNLSEEARQQHAENVRVGILKKNEDPEYKRKLSEGQRRRFSSVDWKALPTEKRDRHLWGIRVRDKYNHKCAKCDETENLDCHHIKPKSQFPDLRWCVDNGILLCKEHHAIAHEELGQAGIAAWIRGLR